MSNTLPHSDKESRELVQYNIDKYGCHLVLIEETDYLPGFVYSIGLYQKYNHPEIICFGLNVELMASLINQACASIAEGSTFTPGTLYSHFLQSYQIQFVEVNKDFYPNYLGYGGWFYDMTFNFPAIQLVWPDKSSLFPWEEGFNADWKFKQPLLDRSMDFKFYEERNVAVFTTSDVIKGASILYVYHNDDGEWQFHSSDSPDINDAKIVCFDDITALDPSINELHHLDYGQSAWRETPDSDWQIVRDTTEENKVDS